MSLDRILSIVFDAVFVIIIVVSFIIGWKKGFLRYAISLVGTIGAFYLASISSKRISGMMETSFGYETFIKGLVSEQISGIALPSFLPEWLIKNLIGSFNDSVGILLANGIVFIAVFLLLRLFVGLIGKLFRSKNLPVLSVPNGIAGGVFEVFVSLLVLGIVLYFVGLLGEEHIVRNAIKNSFLLKYMYDYNPVGLILARVL